MPMDDPDPCSLDPLDPGVPPLLGDRECDDDVEERRWRRASVVWERGRAGEGLAEDRCSEVDDRDILAQFLNFAQIPPSLRHRGRDDWGGAGRNMYEFEWGVY
jgi:hypothetical protein